MDANEETRKFLSEFKQGQSVGEVTWFDFLEYYSDLSATVSDDNYFAIVVWNAWDGASAKGGSRPPPGRSKIF